MRPNKKTQKTNPSNNNKNKGTDINKSSETRFYKDNNEQTIKTR